MKHISIICILFVACVAAGPATRPATQPVTIRTPADYIDPAAPDRVRDFLLAQMPKQSPDQVLAEAEHVLDAMEGGTVDHSRPGVIVTGQGTDHLAYSFGTQMAKDRNIAEAKSAANAAKADIQNVNQNGWKVRCTYEEVNPTQCKAGVIGKPLIIRINQVIDPHTAMVTFSDGFVNGSTVDCLLTVNTADFTDGETTNQRIPVYFTGTTSYTTVLGASRTVLAGELFHPEHYLKPAKQMEASAAHQ